jgi:hypothetical protein
MKRIVSLTIVLFVVFSLSFGFLQKVFAASPKPFVENVIKPLDTPTPPVTQKPKPTPPPNQPPPPPTPPPTTNPTPPDQPPAPPPDPPAPPKTPDPGSGGGNIKPLPTPIDSRNAIAL